MTNNEAIIQATSHKPQATSHKPPIILPSQQTNHYEDFERERLDPIYDIIAPYSLMSINDRYFLNGIIRYFKPRKILEAGVASGGGSAIILNAISDMEESELWSVDYAEESVNAAGKHSGFLVEKKFPQFLHKWHLFRGGDVSRFIEEIGGNIDLVMLDTVHSHPWENLNFLCILPFMKNNAWLVLHDITAYAGAEYRYETACRYVYASVVSDEKITPYPDDGGLFANIGAFRVSDVTRKYIDNMFETLLIPWNIKVSDRDLEDIMKIISKYYSPEQYKFFCDTVKFQDYMFSHPTSLKGAIYGSIKQRANPKLLRFLLKVKRRIGI